MAGILFIALTASAVAASVAFFVCTRVVDSAIPLKWRDPVGYFFKVGSYYEIHLRDTGCQ